VVLQQKEGEISNVSFWYVTVPNRKTIHRIVNKWRQTRLLLDKQYKSKYQVLNEEKLDEISASLEQIPQKSLMPCTIFLQQNLATVHTVSTWILQKQFLRTTLLTV
jgi:transposase